MKFYISGAITNNPNARERFTKAECLLKLNDYKVVNPLKVGQSLATVFSHEEYLQLSFRLIDLCDCVYMLKGWQKSEGAKAELSYAKAIGKRVEYEEINNGD